VIDYDSQASLTNCLNVGLRENETYRGIYEMMEWDLRKILPEEDEFLASCTFEELCEKCICQPTYMGRETRLEKNLRRVVEVEKKFGFDLLPSHIALADYELEVTRSNRGDVGFRLYNVIQQIKAVKEYDYILIDCPPSLGIMSMNAIAAATDGILIPTNLDLMSTRGVENLIEKIAEVQEMLNLVTKGKITHMGIIGVVLNLYSERRTIDKTVENNLEKFYPIVTFKSQIPESAKAKTAVYSGLLFSHVLPKAEHAYQALAEEIEERIKVMEADGQQVLRLEPNDGRKVGE
ncbi:MAG: ParA family protein, partial [Erysipelotrichaceae bacterium]|nr:ParA family protein [Erysipelotrichaceae bacterium]